MVISAHLLISTKLEEITERCSAGFAVMSMLMRSLSSKTSLRASVCVPANGSFIQLQQAKFCQACSCCCEDVADRASDLVYRLEIMCQKSLLSLYYASHESVSLSLQWRPAA